MENVTIDLVADAESASIQCDVVLIASTAVTRACLFKVTQRSPYSLTSELTGV